MSLQYANTQTNFATACYNLWQGWNALGTDAAARENSVRAMVNSMCNFMPAPTVVFAATSGWGSFSWSSWTLRLNQKYTAKDDIKYGKFVEYCTTIYHETRHAEQFYRIAQGLLLGRLTYPDATKAELINQTSSNSVRDRVAMFGGGKVATVTGGTATVGASAMLPSVATVAGWLSMPTSKVTAANSNKVDFIAFCNSAKPAWFKRSSILLEVEEWMRATYKKTYSEMDSFAQAEDDDDEALRDNIYRMYRSLPEENDAHAIEDVVDAAITGMIGHANEKDKRRSQL